MTSRLRDAAACALAAAFFTAMPALAQLSNGPRHVDEIARESGLPIAAVSSTLQLFELTGRVRQTAPMTYALA